MVSVGLGDTSEVSVGSGDTLVVSIGSGDTCMVSDCFVSLRGFTFGLLGMSVPG